MGVLSPCPITLQTARGQEPGLAPCQAVDPGVLSLCTEWEKRMIAVIILTIYALCKSHAHVTYSTLFAQAAAL